METFIIVSSTLVLIPLVLYYFSNTTLNWTTLLAGLAGLFILSGCVGAYEIDRDLLNFEKISSIPLPYPATQYSISLDQKSFNYFNSDPYFVFFHDNGIVKIATPNAGGSGVIISPNGYIITNEHVVENNKIVDVLYKGAHYIGFVIKVGLNEFGVKDLALIRIPEVTPEYIPIYSEDYGMQKNIGDVEVEAIGYPALVKGGDQTYNETKGHLITEDHGEYEANVYICHGSSGGALLNNKHQLIGITEGVYVGLLDPNAQCGSDAVAIPSYQVINFINGV